MPDGVIVMTAIEWSGECSEKFRQSRSGVEMSCVVRKTALKIAAVHLSRFTLTNTG